MDPSTSKREQLRQQLNQMAPVSRNMNCKKKIVQHSELDIGKRIDYEMMQPIPEQWKFISNLKQSNCVLKEEIAVEERNSNIKDAHFGYQMEKSQEECSLLAKKIELENKKLVAYKQQITELEKRIVEQKKILSCNEGNEVPHLIKRLKKKEHKFEQTRIVLNGALAEIKQLKDVCNAKRRERVIFDNVFKKLEQELKKKETEVKEQLRTTLLSEQAKLINLDKIKI